MSRLAHRAVAAARQHCEGCELFMPLLPPMAQLQNLLSANIQYTQVYGQSPLTLWPLALTHTDCPSAVTSSTILSWSGRFLLFLVSLRGLYEVLGVKLMLAGAGVIPQW